LSALSTLVDRRAAVVLASAGLFLDQLSKDLASTLLLGAQPVVLGPFALRLTQNEGAALGILGALPDELRLPLVLSMTALALLVVLPVLAAQVERRGVRDAAVALILSGALGNLVDRLRTGHVVDFITLNPALAAHAPVFNLADVSLIAGATLLLLNRRRAPLSSGHLSPLTAQHLGGRHP
jgi:signal peptidase II